MIPSCSAWLPAFSVVGTIQTTPPAWLMRLAVLLQRIDGLPPGCSNTTHLPAKTSTMWPVMSGLGVSCRTGSATPSPALARTRIMSDAFFCSCRPNGPPPKPPL